MFSPYRKWGPLLLLFSWLITQMNVVRAAASCFYTASYMTGQTKFESSSEEVIFLCCQSYINLSSICNVHIGCICFVQQIRQFSMPGNMCIYIINLHCGHVLDAGLKRGWQSWLSALNRDWTLHYISLAKSKQLQPKAQECETETDLWKTNRLI